MEGEEPNKPSCSRQESRRHESKSIKDDERLSADMVCDPWPVTKSKAKRTPSWKQPNYWSERATPNSSTSAAMRSLCYQQVAPFLVFKEVRLRDLFTASVRQK